MLDFPVPLSSTGFPLRVEGIGEGFRRGEISLFSWNFFLDSLLLNLSKD